MDPIEDARVKIVLAMDCLEDALVERLPAKSPRSNADEIKQAIGALKRRTQMTLRHVADVEQMILGR
tara:strand:- start:2799 stop:2999 length:201 start_codon:yes stop_codon:yes gene_type:complete